MKLKLHITILVLNDNAYGVRAQQAALLSAVSCRDSAFSSQLPICCHAASGAAAKLDRHMLGAPLAVSQPH